jgi:hypothetical protein
MPFMTRDNVDFITFDLTVQQHFRSLAACALPELLGHLLYIILIQVKFLMYLMIRLIERHQVQAMHPDFQRLMVA